MTPGGSSRASVKRSMTAEKVSPTAKRRPSNRSPEPTSSAMNICLAEHLKLCKSGAKRHNPAPKPAVEEAVQEASTSQPEPEKMEDCGDGIPNILGIDLMQLRNPRIMGNARAHVDFYRVVRKNNSFGPVTKLKSFKFPVNSGMAAAGKSVEKVDIPLDIGDLAGSDVEFHYCVRIKFEELKPKAKRGRRSIDTRQSLNNELGSNDWHLVEIMFGCEPLVVLEKNGNWRYINKPASPLVSARDLAGTDDWINNPSFLDQLVENTRKQRKSMSTHDHSVLVTDFSETEEPKKANQPNHPRRTGKKKSRATSPVPVVPEIPTDETRFWVFHDAKHFNRTFGAYIIYRFVADDEPSTERVTKMVRTETDFKMRMRIIPPSPEDDKKTVSALASEANKCLFCGLEFDDMLDLMKHLRSSYPRFKFFYKMLHETTEWPIIELSVNHEVDSTSAPTVDDAAGLFQFLTIEDNAKVSHKRTRPMATHATTLTLLYEPTENIKNAKFGDVVTKLDQEAAFKRIDKLGCSAERKTYFKLWWTFCDEDELARGRHDLESYVTMRRFLSSKREELTSNDLKVEFLAHITRCAERDLLNQDDVHDLACHFADPNYDPHQDQLSMINRPSKVEKAQWQHRQKYEKLYLEKY